MTLIGWQSSPPEVDGGIPSTVAQLLAEALTATTRISFLTSRFTASQPLLPNDHVRLLGKGTWSERLADAWQQMPATPMSIITTSNPQTAQCLFDDPLYPWCLRGQAVVFCTADTDALELQRKDWLSLLADDWTHHLAQLAQTFPEIVGALRPGVDGSIAGLFALMPEFKTALLADLAERTKQAGFSWRHGLSETEFMSRIA